MVLTFFMQSMKASIKSFVALQHKGVAKPIFGPKLSG